MKIISASACKEPVSVSIEYEDGITVCAPFHDGNQDYEAYKEWLAEGNTPNPYVPPPEPAPLTPAEKLAAAGLSVTELKELLGI